MCFPVSVFYSDKQYELCSCHVVRKHCLSRFHLTMLDLSCIFTVVNMQVGECFVGNNALLILMAHVSIVYGHKLKAEVKI